MRRELLLFSIFFLMAVFLSPGQPFGAPYFEGKIVKIVVGNEPGGGFDRMARLLAKYLPKQIPGKPTFVVENMPGAQCVIATNYIYNIAKPDGLTLGAIDKAIPFAQLFKAPGVKFDVTKLCWVGSAGVEPVILTMRTDLPYKTFDDVMKAKNQIFLGSAGKTGIGYQFPTLTKELLGLNIKMINYVSSPEIVLAMERKEVDGRAGSYSSLKPQIDSGLVRALLRGRVSVPEIDALPSNEDYAKDDKAKTLMAMLSTADLLGRPYIAPPGTPAEVAGILRDSFAKVAKDPELQAECKKLKMLPVEYISGDQILKTISFIFNQPPETIKEFNKYVQF
jgi:tripartite-type tricarboxylate transporter receptor subunit TctC